MVARRVRQRKRLEPGATLGAQQPELTALRHAAVVEHRVGPLLPLPALVDQRVTQPHTPAQIEDVPGRDPRLRQPGGHDQLPQQPRVGPVALGALLAPPPLRGLSSCAANSWPSPRLEPVTTATESCRFISLKSFA